MFQKIKKNYLNKISFFQSDKRKQPVETGRSMVEILGVMAVIGVLTVGGISGYRFAMDKYRANDIVNEVNLRNRDTWTVYQTKDLPEDVDELEEWVRHTQTGFPIHVYPRSRILFDVQVDDVPPRVCKNVLQLPLEGPMFVWTTTDEDCTVDDCTKSIFNGANVAEVCGEEENVSMVFTTSLEAYDAPPRGGDRNCIDDSDCRSCEVCSSYTCRSTCPDDKPICVQKPGQTPEEATCEECGRPEDCPDGQICDEKTYTCITIPPKCDPGYFRTKNGACIKCSETSSFIISPEVFTAHGKVYDEPTGEQMCDNCETVESEYKTKRYRGTDKNGVTYCSFGCIKGVSIQQHGGGCAPCYDENGEPTKNKIVIPNELEAHTQCLSCGGRTWYAANNSEKHVCGFPFECEKGTFAHNYRDASLGWHDLKCISCKEKNEVAQWMSGPGQWMTKAKNSCNECPTDEIYNCYTVGKCAGRDNKYQTCAPKCWQPEEGSEASEICKTDPTSPKCKRQWRDNDLKCYPCNYVGASSAITNNRWKDDFKELCEKCGREINKQNYCVLKDGNDCPIGQFLGSDGSCHECSENKGVEIESEAKSGCQANCFKKDSTYYKEDEAPEGSASTRWSKTYDGKTYCYPKCPYGQVNSTFWGGECSNCSGNESFKLNTASDPCSEQCPHYEVEEVWGTYCAPKNCGTGYYKRRFGECSACSSGNYGDGDIQNGSYGSTKGIELCEACGNRIVLNKNGNRCYKLDPGVSGVCNNIETPQVSDKANADLKAAAIPYLNGSQNGVLFRDNDGYCRRCDSEKTYTSTQAQCASCDGLRRYSSSIGECIYATCTEETTFLNKQGTCVPCSTGTTEIGNNDTSKNLCNSCSGRRFMTTVSGVFCVPKCDELDNEWQDSAGNCYDKTNTTTKEIGTDDKSISLCRNAGHVAYSVGARWYCKMPVADKFMKINGDFIDCSSNGKEEIPDTQDAQNLCLGLYGNGLGCITTLRETKLEDGKTYCIKK